MLFAGTRLFALAALLSLAPLHTAVAIESETSTGKPDFKLSSIKVDHDTVAINVTRIATNESTEIELSGLVDEIKQTLTKGSRAVILGKLKEGAGEYVGCIDCQRGVLVAEVLGRNFQLSPDRAKLAFESFYPKYAEDIQIWPVVSVMEFWKDECPTSALFPSGGYGAVKETDLVKKYYTLSPFVWSADSTMVAFISERRFFREPEESEFILVGMDLQRGVDQATVASRVLTPEEFVYSGVAPDSARLVVKSFSLGEDGRLELKYQDKAASQKEPATLSLTWKEVLKR